MKLTVYNSEPDGRARICFGQNESPMFVIGIDAIDNFAKALRKHSGSGGDGKPFEVDLTTGEIKTL